MLIYEVISRDLSARCFPNLLEPLRRWESLTVSIFVNGLFAANSSELPEFGGAQTFLGDPRV